MGVFLQHKASLTDRPCHISKVESSQPQDACGLKGCVPSNRIVISSRVGWLRSSEVGCCIQLHGMHTSCSAQQYLPYDVNTCASDGVVASCTHIIETHVRTHARARGRACTLLQRQTLCTSTCR